MQKSPHTLIWVIIVIIVAILAYWLGMTRQNTALAPTVSDAEIVTETVKPAATTPVLDEVSETIKPRVEGNQIYTNDKYDFTLEIPARWKNYRVVENLNNPNGDSYSFELKKNDRTYGSVFSLTAHPRKVWENMQKEEGPKPSYLGEKNAVVFGFSYAQDDSNFAGFGEPEEGLRFKGPIFDAQEIIIPSFELR